MANGCCFCGSAHTRGGNPARRTTDSKTTETTEGAGSWQILARFLAVARPVQCENLRSNLTSSPSGGCSGFSSSGRNDPGTAGFHRCGRPIGEPRLEYFIRRIPTTSKKIASLLSASALVLAMAIPAAAAFGKAPAQAPPTQCTTGSGRASRPARKASRNSRSPGGLAQLQAPSRTGCA